MAINDQGLFQAARGTLFTAPAKTPLPADMTKFLLTAGEVPAGTDGKVVWDNLGHTSDSNKISFSKDGGDTSSKSTWLVAAARTSKEASTLTVSGASAQVDKATIQKITNGWDGDNGGTVVPIDGSVQQMALFILAYDDSDRLSFGLYIPETDFAYDALDLSGSDFVEISFKAIVKASHGLAAGPNGEIGGYEVFGPDTFGAAANKTASGASTTTK